MAVRETIWSVIGLIILFAVLAFVVTNKNGCSPAPEIKPGKSDTVITRIFIHDTLRDTVPHDSIRLVPVIRYRDTSTNTIVTTRPDSSGKYVPDTTGVCYTVNRVEKDSACIEVAVCSDSLPKQKPIDLSFNIKYLPPPKIQMTIFRTDTLLKFKPIYQNWQLYAIAAATFALGMYAAHK
jgi:hypothetical protein